MIDGCYVASNCSTGSNVKTQKGLRPSIFGDTIILFSPPSVHCYNTHYQFIKNNRCTCKLLYMSKMSVKV